MTDDQSPESVDEQPPVAGPDDASGPTDASGSTDSSGATDASAPDDASQAAAADPAADGARSVAVPMRLYKTVTVFATLIAMVAVILGFVLLDVATNRARAAAEDVDLVLALLGLASIVFGAAVYAFSTRFQAVGMGKSKDESDEEPDNG